MLNVLMRRKERVKVKYTKKLEKIGKVIKT